MSEIKKVFGIDSLYFFFETNENYDDLFLEILDQLEEIKGKFEKRDIEFENKDLTISINDIQLSYLGKQEGFYWFKDSNEFFRIGFKDRYKNTCIAKYGVSNIFKSDEIKNKIKNTFLKKYGVDSYTKTDEFKECIKNHNLNKYDVEYFFQSEYFKEKLNLLSSNSRKCLIPVWLYEKSHPVVF